MDYMEGKIYCDVRSLYKRDNQLSGDAVINIKKINYNSNKINAKLYTKFSLGEKIDLKLKILNFKFNDFEIEDITEKITIHNNKITIERINKDGFYGEIKL